MRYVTPEQMDELKKLLRASERCRELSKHRGLTLAQKIVLQRQSRELFERAQDLGK